MSKFSDSLAEAVQKILPAEIIAGYFVAIIMGQNPVVEHDDSELGWKIVPGDGEPPTQEEKIAAMKILKDLGYGADVED